MKLVEDWKRKKSGQTKVIELWTKDDKVTWVVSKDMDFDNLLGTTTSALNDLLYRAKDSTEKVMVTTSGMERESAKRYLEQLSALIEVVRGVRTARRELMSAFEKEKQ